MIDSALFCQLALALPETDQAPHEDKVAFRVKKKNFAILNYKGRFQNKGTDFKGNQTGEQWERGYNLYPYFDIIPNRIL